ncbi:MAG: cupin domain-containing protein [Deltaproteobacteria bacterium]|nr:cupin domain-containing protein [Deltaproteobacteria bacterium]
MNHEDDPSDEFGDVDAELLLLAVDPVEPHAKTKQALLQAIAGPWYAPFARRVAELCEIPLEAAHDLLAAVDDAGRWMVGPAAGTQAFHIDAGPGLEGAIVGFIRIAPGAVFPLHTHVGAEDVLVLQGAFVVGDVEVRAGSEMPMAAGSRHEVRALGEGCLYLGVVREGMDFGDGVVGPEDPHI